MRTLVNALKNRLFLECFRSYQLYWRNLMMNKGDSVTSDEYIATRKAEDMLLLKNTM